MNKSHCGLKTTTNINIVQANEGNQKIECCTSTVNDASAAVNDSVHQSNEMQISKVAKTSAEEKSKHHPQRSGYNDKTSTIILGNLSTQNQHSSSSMNIYPILDGKCACIYYTQ